MVLLIRCASSKFTQSLAMLLLLSAPLYAQAPARLRSTDIHPDHGVTFSYKDAAARKVSLALDGVEKPIPMEKDANGIWTVTTQPLAPEIYGYHFESDGDRRLDPLNPDFTLNLVNISNLVTVPGDTPQPWEDTNVPHGTLHHHIYATATVLGLHENQSGYFVYTPPGYDEKSKKPYRSSI
jgi:hypothetical protein